MDHVPKEVRSRIMAAIRSRGNTTTELPLAKLLWEAGLRGYRKHWPVAGKPDFSAFYGEVHGAKFLYGDFLNALISFLLIAAAVYYFVVLPVNALMARFHRDEPAAKMQCPQCLSDIPIGAHKCAFCASAV